MVAPVREVVSQLLAHLLQHMTRRSVLHVHEVLLDMVHQTKVSSESLQVQTQNGAAHFGPKVKALGKSPSVTHVWQVRHAGLIGIKYEVAVRADLVGVDEEGGRELLKGVVDAALLG